MGHLLARSDRTPITRPEPETLKDRTLHGGVTRYVARLGGLRRGRLLAETSPTPGGNIYFRVPNKRTIVLPCTTRLVKGAPPAR